MRPRQTSTLSAPALAVAHRSASATISTDPAEKPWHLTCDNQRCNQKEVRIMFKALATGTVVLGLAAAPAFAGQQPTGGQHPTSGQQTKTTQGAGKTTAGAKSSDENFVTKAAMGGMAEVELGR